MQQDCTQSTQTYLRESKTKGNFPAAPHLPTVALLAVSWWTSHVPWWIPWPVLSVNVNFSSITTVVCVATFFWHVGMQWEWNNDGNMGTALSNELLQMSQARRQSQGLWVQSVCRDCRCSAVPLGPSCVGAQALALCAAYKSCFFPILKFSVITGVPSLRDIRNTLRMIQTCSQKHKTETIQCKASFLPSSVLPIWFSLQSRESYYAPSLPNSLVSVPLSWLSFSFTWSKSTWSSFPPISCFF